MSFYVISNQTKLPFNEEMQEATMDDLVAFCNSTKVIGVDLETTSLDCHTGKILLLSIGGMDTQYVVDVTTVSMEPLREILANKPKVLHNGKFDYKFFKKAGFKLGNFMDTMLFHQVLTNGMDKSSSLGNIVYEYFNVMLEKSTRNEFANHNGVFTTKQLEYSALDVKFLPMLATTLYGQLKGYELDTVALLECYVSVAYAEMEYNGFYLNKDYWYEHIINRHKQLKNRLIIKFEDFVCNEPSLSQFKLDAIAVDLFGNEVPHFSKSKANALVNIRTSLNFDSNAQMLKVLNLLGYSCVYVDEHTQKEKVGVPEVVLNSYSSEEVNDLINQSELEQALEKSTSFPEMLNVYRKIAKILSTYGESFLLNVNESTGRIHTSFNLCGTDTGRVSSDSPNMQNIPASQLFRSGFQAPNGRLLICADYSNAELRIIADHSQETAMIKAFNDGEDIHSYMATIAFKQEVTKKVNKHLRNNIKTVNFGLAYGSSAKKFAPIFGGDKEAQHFLDNVYYKNFPKLKSYFANQGKFAQDNGYSSTLPPYKRIRWYNTSHLLKTIKENEFNSPEAKSARKELGEVKRAGMNQPIQGTSADIMKKATLDIYNFIVENNLDALLVNQVHDELVIEISPDIKDFMIENVKRLMEKAGAEVIKSVVMTVDIDCETYWKK